MRTTRTAGCMRFAIASLAYVLSSAPLASVYAISIVDDFSYADSAAFESVYTLSSTSGGGWNASFDGDKMSVSNSTPATGAFDHYYARRSLGGSLAGDFNASLDLTWLSTNEGGERARIALQLLKGDGTGAHSTSLPQNEAWTFPNDVTSAGMWNDYGVNAMTLLIGGLEGPDSGMTAQFPWRPGPEIGASGAAKVSFQRVGGNLTATYNDGSLVRTHTVPNSDEITHIGIWYSHFTGFPGQFDGSATYTVDNLIVQEIPEPSSVVIAAIAMAALGLFADGSRSTRTFARC